MNDLWFNKWSFFVLNDNSSLFYWFNSAEQAHRTVIRHESGQKGHRFVLMFSFEQSNATVNFIKCLRWQWPSSHCSNRNFQPAKHWFHVITSNASKISEFSQSDGCHSHPGTPNVNFHYGVPIEPTQLRHTNHMLNQKHIRHICFYFRVKNKA